MGRTCGKTPEQQMGTDFYNVGPPHRQKAMRQTSKQMDGLRLEDRRSALVQSCKESKRLENSTESCREKNTRWWRPRWSCGLAHHMSFERAYPSRRPLPLMGQNRLIHSFIHIFIHSFSRPPWSGGIALDLQAGTWAISDCHRQPPCCVRHLSERHCTWSVMS